MAAVASAVATVRLTYCRRRHCLHRCRQAHAVSRLLLALQACADAAVCAIRLAVKGSRRVPAATQPNHPTRTGGREPNFAHCSHVLRLFG